MLKFELFEKIYFSDHRNLKLFVCTGLQYSGKELNALFLNYVL